MSIGFTIVSPTGTRDDVIMQGAWSVGGRVFDNITGEMGCSMHDLDGESVARVARKLATALCWAVDTTLESPPGNGLDSTEIGCVTAIIAACIEAHPNSTVEVF